MLPRLLSSVAATTVSARSGLLGACSVAVMGVAGSGETSGAEAPSLAGGTTTGGCGGECLGVSDSADDSVLLLTDV